MKNVRLSICAGVCLVSIVSVFYFEPSRSSKKYGSYNLNVSFATLRKLLTAVNSIADSFA